MFQTKQKAELELNFFEYSNSIRYLAEPDIVEYDKMKKYGIILDFEDNMITFDEVKLAM
jgi:hypothetical protein